MDLARRIERLEADSARQIERLTAQLKQRDAIIEQQKAVIAQQEAVIERQNAQIKQLQQQVQTLEARVAELEHQLQRNSKNSNRPPSSDPPAPSPKQAPRPKQKGPKNQPQRTRGGQPGHKGAKRALVPQDQLNHIENYFPDACHHCASPLPKVLDAHPKRHQVTDLIDFKPHITEHRRHRVQCPQCGKSTCAPPLGLAFRYQLGPRLCAVIALLTGVYHLSRRNTVGLLMDLFGVPVSLGAVSGVEGRMTPALKGPYDEAFQKARRAKVKHTDGTGWKQAGRPMQVWTLATTLVTVFKIVVDGSQATLKALFKIFRGTLISDRARALSFWSMEQRQICWAHLLRKFLSFAQRDGPAQFLGLDLLDLTGLLFEYWHAYKDGRLDQAALLHRMAPVRAQIEALLVQGQQLGLPGVSGACADILFHKAALWTFLETAGVEPTNNRAERALRSFVLWRKRSFGAQSDRGHRFAERMMTICMTGRQQGLGILDFLTSSYKAWLEGRAAPSLFCGARSS